LQEDHHGGFPGREKSKRWQFRFNPPNLKCARCFGNLLIACGRGALDDSQWILKKPFHYFSEFTPSLNLEEKNSSSQTDLYTTSVLHPTAISM
jgi:hypothetical protein